MADPFAPIGPDLEKNNEKKSIIRQLGWFVAIALISVCVVAATAYLLRFFLFL